MDIITITDYEYSDYIEEMVISYIGTSDLNMDDVINNKEFLDCVEKDLLEVGFTSEEASEINNFSFSNKSVIYKFLAYCFSRVGDFNTIEELRSVLDEYYAPFRSSSDFTKEDLNKIVKARKLLNC